ncbi:hypothetical protein RB595_006115 [Gaeumannomyces hyphopodioides]
MAPRTDFPPVRACLFDMDGLLLDTEDKYTECVNRVLAKYGRPNLPWSIKAPLQGRPAVQANKLFSSWAKLPITEEEYAAELAVHQRDLFPTSAPLPGVERLLRDLSATRVYSHMPTDAEEHPRPEGAVGHKVHLALATSSTKINMALKTSHLPPDLFGVFELRHVVTGDDERVPAGRGKPLPDIYLAALRTLNEALVKESPGERPIEPKECLVFEDSVPGVEAARRAGMRVVWCPHPMLEREFRDRHAEVLAGLTGAAGADVEPHTLGELGDGWGEYLPSLEDFPYAEYGIVLAGEGY